MGTADAPEWVEDVPLGGFASDRSGQIRGGIAFLLSDRQVRKTVTGFEYFHRFAYEVVDRTGLEDAARITYSFDPTRETVSFNAIRIQRDGAEINRLADAEVTVLRQEEDLENSLIDGDLTALVQLEDVRVGDVIEYALSGVVEQELWPDELFWMAQVEWQVPLAQMHFKLSVPEELTVSYRSVSTDLEPEVVRQDGWTSYKLHVHDPKPVRLEDNLPNDYVSFGLVAFTTMDEWSDVVDWAEPLFTFDEALPEDFVAQLDEIAANYSTPGERATHALRLVQDQIRYLGLEIGLGSHVPRAPGVTLKRGYGDCKDKSVLLVSALEYLGIDAVPALASIASGGTLPQLPPSIGSFDHVIVEFDIEGKKFWADPTLTHQGGVAEDLTSLNYGYVLPIRPDQTELVEMEVRVPSSATLEFAETFDFSEADDLGLRIRIEHTYRGSWADYQRLRLVNSGSDSLALGYLDFYAAYYDELIEEQPLEISDDLDANVIVVTAHYMIDAEALARTNYRNELPIYATALQRELPSTIEANRLAPLRLNYGANFRHIIRIVLPGKRLNLPEDKSRIASGVSYSRTFEQLGDTLVMDYSLLIGQEVIDLASVKPVLDLADEIADDTELVIRLNSAMPTPVRRLGFQEELDPATIFSIELIQQKVDDKDYVDALTYLNSLLGSETDRTDVRGYLQLQKALVLVELGRKRAAIRPFNEAFELYQPPRPDGYFKYLNVLRDSGEYERTVEVMGELFDKHPEAVASLNMQWISGLWQMLDGEDLRSAQDDMSLILARAVHKHNVDNVDEFSFFITETVETLSQNGNEKEAMEYLENLKDPVAFASLLTQKKSQAIWEAVEEHTGNDLSRAIKDYVKRTWLSVNLAPSDFQVLTRHIQALRMAEEYEEATQIADRYIENWPRIEAVGEHAYWFVNETAYALSDAGKPDEALELMDRLVDLDVEENASLISMAINRAQMLMHWGEFEATLEAVETLEALADNYATDYGRMWIFDAKACSLHQLGRREDAMAVLTDSIEPISDKNKGAYTKTLLCLDETDRAAELLINRLQDATNRTSVILSFSQTSRPSTMAPFLAELEQRGDAVRARADVMEEFGKVGRSITIDGARTYWGDF